MLARTAEVSVTYNGVNVTTQMGDHETDFSYTDNASDESDSIDIGIQDAVKRWLGPWFPTKGDILTAAITVRNWRSQGDTHSLACGSFILDDFSFRGPPTTGTISAVATPANSAFKETKNTKTWEEVTIKEIAKVIAADAGLTLVYDVSAAPFTIASLEQSDATDSAFLADLCTTYGLCMKVYSEKIVIFDREEYKAKPAGATLDVSDLESWTWQSTLAGTYTGGEITYTDPQTEEDVTFAIGEGPRILKLNEKAENTADAERKIKAAVNNANHGSTSMSVTIMGDPRFVASQCVNITGLEKFNGKYYIDTVNHKLGNGYTMDLSLSLVELVDYGSAYQVETSQAAAGTSAGSQGSKTTAAKILAVAAAQVGTQEQPLGSNNVKYNTEYYGQAVNGSAYAWCCVFVWWVFKEAGCSGLFYSGGKTAWCPTLYWHYESLKKIVKTGYMPGDIVFFYSEGAINHVGIVEKVEGNILYTIEGNSSNAVERRQRSTTSPIGAARVCY